MSNLYKSVVCHISSAHSRYDVRIFEKECVSLAKAGFNVYLVINDDAPDEIIEGVHICSTGKTFKKRMDRMRKGTREVYELAKKIDADIYHFHDPELLQYGLKLKRQNKRVIFDSHERYAKQILAKAYIPKFMRKVVSSAYHSYETKVCKKIDATIIPSTRDDFTSFAGRSKQCVIVGNFPILQKDRNVDVRRNLKQRIMVQPGSLTENRGITEMVKAGHLTQSKVILAGDISDEYKDYLFSLKEASCIEYRGQLRQTEVYDLIREGGIGISVLHDVGQYSAISAPPTKVLEYASFGIPIIGSKTAKALCEFIETYRCGLAINPLDMDEYIAAINYLYENPDEAIEMGKRGKKAVEEKYNWESDAGKLISLYKDILKI